MKLLRLSTVEEFKKIENPTNLSRFALDYVNGKTIRAKWTINRPLILEKESGEIVIVDKWFINLNNELIWSTKNDYFNIEMYEGITEPKSSVLNAYMLVTEETTMNQDQITFEQLNDMKHALGIDLAKMRKGRRKCTCYRNWFVMTDNASWNDLVDKGYAKKDTCPVGNYYVVSQKGKERLAELFDLIELTVSR